MANHSTVIGIFESEREAQEVAEDLKEKGFSAKDIHIDEKAVHKPGWFSRLFGIDDEQEAVLYYDALRDGRSLVAVDADEEKIERAADIMERHGALDIDEEVPKGERRDLRRERRPAASANPPVEPIERTTGTARETSRATGVMGSERGSEQRIPVVEEKMGVAKRRVLHGGVRVYTHVEEKPVEQQINLTEERVHVERHPVDRPISLDEESTMRDQVIEVTETREEPVVSKTARVVEEVVIDKEFNQRTETVRDTLRRTDVRVEPLAAETGNIPADITADFRRNFETQYAGRDYAEYDNAYNLGYRAAADPQFRGKKFDDVEDRLRMELQRLVPNGDWQQMRNAVRYGWERRSREA